jgi:hypothetical protein
VAGERVEGDQPADDQRTVLRPDLIEPLDRLQADEDIGCDQPFLHQTEQIAATAG